MSQSNPTPAIKERWWQRGVIYEVYPRSFQDSDGDGVGDLRGLIGRLEYLAWLGVDAIWVAPFFPSPMADFGYDVMDYTGVDPLFGTLDDADRLIAAAHRHGLKVIFDYVPNHSSDQHPWFRDSRASRQSSRRDWYIWRDPAPGGGPPNNWLSVFGGPAWHWDSQRRQYYLHSFLASQADLNFHHPAVQDALLGEVRFWCERGVDGFRFDASNHQFHDRQLRSNPPATAAEQAEVSTVRPDNPYAMQRHLHDKTQPENLAFLERLRALLDEYGAASIGEVGDEHPLPVMADYTEAGKRLHMAYSFALLTPEASGPHIREQVQGLEAELARTGGWGCWALSNHDVPRVATRWAPRGQADNALSATLLALLLTLKGSVCLYQGEELGLPEADIPFARLQDPYGKAFWPRFKGRDGCRTPMPWWRDAVNAGFNAGAEPWLPLGADHAQRAVDVQEADPASVLAQARALLAWRRREAVLRQGEIRFHHAPGQHALLFERLLPDQAPLVLAFNLGGRALDFPLPDTLGGLSPLSGTPLPMAQLSPDGRSWHLPPHSAAVATR